MQGSWWVAAAMALCMGGRAAADVGVPVASGRIGSIDVRVLVAPAPLRVGSSSWSILVSEAGAGQSLHDVDLELTLLAPAGAPPPAVGHGDHPGTLLLHPDPPQAGSRLFHVQGVDLPVPGVWHGTLRVRGEGASETFGFQAAVAPASSALVAHWRAFAIVPGGLALFLLHQILRRRTHPRSGAE